MHCTRRLRDGGLAALALIFVPSCSDSERASFEAPAEAGANLPPPGQSDASPGDGGRPPPVSLTPRKVTCTERPCAIDLSPDSRDGLSYCALLDDGRVVCWGVDVQGRLGRLEDGGGTGGFAGPGFVWNVSDAIALEGTCVLRRGGTAQCWGPWARVLPFDGVEKLSTGSPNRCAVLGPDAWSCLVDSFDPDGGWSSETKAFTLPPGSPIRKLVVVYAGPGDATFILREDGTLLTSGARNMIGRETSLMPEDPLFGEVLLANVTDIDVGTAACAVAGGDIYCWGQLEQSATLYPEQALPSLIRLPEPAVQVSAVGFSKGSTPPEPSVRRMCATTASGAVYCTGFNAFGQAGDGTRTTAHAPVKTRGLPEPAVRVRATRGSTCALVESGKVYCWGSGGAGALGTGLSEDAVEAVQVKMP